MTVRRQWSQTMAREIEIKLSFSPDRMAGLEAALLALPGARQGDRLAMRNTYYDTPDGQLNQHMMALRLRDAGGRPIQTLKTRGALSGGVASRGEWEWPLSSYQLDYRLLAETPLADSPLLPLLGPSFDTHFQRHIVDILPRGDDGPVVEAALDHGEVLAGGQSKPLCELELELKAGDPERLQRLAYQVSQSVPLFLNTISKAEQGYHLAGLYHPRIGDSSSDDPVDAWLHGLSVHWLEDSQAGWPAVLALHGELRDKAMQAGQEQAWQSVLTALEQHSQDATPPREALQSMEQLAPLQLSLALG
ncbi:MAG: CYTH domain-containing protein [Oleiphilaceae bacterium]|nr:CYTH domain-containing protein [Oleiphilaceae bacterium]